jgi:malate dehydrogenase (oxaloacetate-decarboxylating)(NADP+)
VETGEADALITGVYTKYADSIQAAKDVIGLRPGLKYMAAMHIMNTKKGTFFLADTLFNRHPTTETLIDIAKLTHDTVKFFARDPVMAMLSYSNFGSDKTGSPASVHLVVETLHKTYPEMVVDGEMQVTFALNKDLRDKKFPFSKLAGKNVNTLIFPNLSSANVAYKMLIEMGLAETIGPIQMGLNKPIHILDVESSVRDIVNMTAIAVLDAIVEEKIRTNNLQRIN